MTVCHVNSCLAYEAGTPPTKKAESVLPELKKNENIGGITPWSKKKKTKTTQGNKRNVSGACLRFFCLLKGKPAE